jgi:hypothetical protein
MGPICCPETSVSNYHTTPRNTPEQRRSHLKFSGTSCTVKMADCCVLSVAVQLLGGSAACACTVSVLCTERGCPVVGR